MLQYLFCGDLCVRLCCSIYPVMIFVSICVLQYLSCGDFCVRLRVAVSILWRFLCLSVCCNIYPVVVFVSLCVAVSIISCGDFFVSICMLQYLSSPYTAMAYQPPLHSGPLLHTMAAEVRTFLLSPPSFHTLMLGSPINHNHKTS